MQYKVAHATGHVLDIVIKELESKVQDLYEEGYWPQGGISTTVVGPNYFIVCQAMIKE